MSEAAYILWCERMGYTRSLRGKHTWQAATAAERERWEPIVGVIQGYLNVMGTCLLCGAKEGPDAGEFSHYADCKYIAAIREGGGG